MVDIVDKKTRSRMMSGIRSSNTRPEVLTRSALHKLGYRFRLNSKVGKIKPDIVLTWRKIAIFVHGCYWHQHQGCKMAYSDRNYSQKWKNKFEDNRLRDERVLKTLKEEGWRVAVVWECATREEKVFLDAIHRLNSWIISGAGVYFETSYKKK